MRKKIWKILPLVTGLVLLTAGSALTVHGESDNTIDVTLFKLNLPDDWSYDPNDISDYENTCSVSVFEGADKDSSQNDFTIKANEESSYYSIHLVIIVYSYLFFCYTPFKKQFWRIRNATLSCYTY